MRILLVHNLYGSAAPSGENSVVLEERDLLRSAGHEVMEHFTYSDTVRDHGVVALIRAGLSVPWNQRALRQVRRLIVEFAPHVMHVHNVFPLLSPAVFAAAAGSGTAVVNTLHNYRPLCANALLLRRGTTCTECLDSRSVLPALRFGCYRGSGLATVPLAISVALHRRLGTYHKHVDAFIVFTEFQKTLLARAGFPERNIHVRPNCLPSSTSHVPWDEREEKCVFIGRASPEKGLSSLIQAWALWGSAAPRLEVIGSGPELEALTRDVPSAVADRISFLGARPPQETQILLSRARLLIIPSTCYEAFPLVLRDALGHGVPVAASRLGALEELIGPGSYGWLFAPGDPKDLQRVVASLWRAPDELQRMSLAERRAAETAYSPGLGSARLQSIYRLSIEHRQHVSPGRRELTSENA